MTVRSQAGFTILELMVALALAGAVMTIAVVVTGEINAASRRAQVPSDGDREALVERWLRAALGSIDVGANGTVTFDGLDDQVVFRSRQLTRHGWSEAVTIQVYADRGQLLARLSTGRQLLLLPNVISLRTSYLIEPGAYPRWSPHWSSALMVPPAIRFELDRRLSTGPRTDTLLFALGRTG